ncbi:MAG TPA: AMP-binding protein [Bacillota bacterium]
MRVTFEPECATIGGFFDWCARRYRDEVILIHRDRVWTYGEFAHEVERTARALLALGVEPGDRVGLWMANRPQWLAVQLAAGKVGAVLVPINTRYKAGELAYILRQGGLRFLILMERFLGIDYPALVLEALRNPDFGVDGGSLTLIVQEAGEGAEARPPAATRSTWRELASAAARVLSYDEFLAAGDAVDPSEVSRRQAATRGDDLAGILYTSGTTSFSKGVMLGHRQIIEHEFKVGNCHDYGPGDRLIVVLPMFGSFICCNAVYSTLSHGAALILQEVADAGETLRLFEEHRATSIYAVEAILQDLFRHPDFGRRDLSSWRKCQAAPVEPATLRRLVEELGVTGLQNGYGMTETCALATLTHGGDPLEKRITTQGRPIEGVEVRIVDVDSGEDVPPNTMGQILVRGPNVTRGYFGMPDETAKALAGGWLHTGDLGVLDDDGYLIFKGRIKEMVKPGGFNVSALELEAFFNALPEVEETAIIGVPDARLGEAVVAVVRLAAGVEAGPETARRLIEHARKHLANFKVPKAVFFVDDYPRTPTGKVQKFKLVERFAGRVD